MSKPNLSLKGLSIKECDKIIKNLYDERERVIQHRIKLENNRQASNAEKKLTKNEAKQFRSLVLGKKFSTKVTTLIGKECVKTDKVDVSLTWDEGYDCSVVARLDDGQYYDIDLLLNSKTIQKKIDDFNNRIEKFDTKMTKKYGDDWISLVD